VRDEVALKYPTPSSGYGRGFGRRNGFDFGLLSVPLDVSRAAAALLDFVVLFAHITLYFTKTIRFGSG
jgi:hypothetical protein